MTQEEFDELEVTEINEFTPLASIAGDEKALVQTPAGNNNSCSIAQMSGYAFPASCNSAASAATKIVTIEGYHGNILPQLVACSFTYGNTYGDITASPATHPYIQFKNADGVSLGNARDLCDCRGNFAGTGCFKAGNIIYLSTIGTKTLMINHDIRQQTDTMTIKADGLKEYPIQETDVTVTTSAAGNAPTGISDAIFEKITSSGSGHVCLQYAGQWVRIMKDSSSFELVKNTTVTLHIRYRKYEN